MYFLHGKKNQTRCKNVLMPFFIFGKGFSFVCPVFFGWKERVS